MPVRGLVWANAKIVSDDVVLYDKVRFVIDGGTKVRLLERGAAKPLIGEWVVLEVTKHRGVANLTVEVDGEPQSWVVTRNGCGCHG